MGPTSALREVTLRQDTEEFEVETNREFNKNYEEHLKTIDNGSTLDPVSRRRGVSLRTFQVDDQILENFSFRQRYRNNVSHGRKTTVVDKFKEYSLSRKRYPLKSQFTQSINHSVFS